MRLARTEKEINEQLNLAFDQIDAGKTKWHGMTYEEGVERGIRWAIGDFDEKPMEE